MKKLPNRVKDMSWLFAEFGQLARKFNAVDLAIGSPELDPPQFLKDRLAEAIEKGPHQYTDPRGYGPLREAVAKHYNPYYSNLGRELDVDTEVIATAGAVSGLFSWMMALVEPGEEVITFEPFWPGVVNITKAAGGVLKTVPMKMQKNESEHTISWEYDWKALEDTLSENTKVVVLINPHNPSGKVFSEQELDDLTDILNTKAPGAYVVWDDVYDFCKFEDEKEYLTFANHKDNFKKTITCYNGGKRFACTGWKVAWVIGPKDLMKHVLLMHQTIVWNFNSPGQYAFAKAFSEDAVQQYMGYDNYFKYVIATYKKVNKELVKVFQDSGLPLYPAYVEGGFSMTIEISEWEKYIPEKYFSNEYIDDPDILKRDFGDEKVPLDYAFCRWMACEVGLAMIPGSSLYNSNENARYDLARISICKQEDIVDRVAEKLKVLKSKLGL